MPKIKNRYRILSITYQRHEGDNIRGYNPTINVSGVDTLKYVNSEKEARQIIEEYNNFFIKSGGAQEWVWTLYTYIDRKTNKIPNVSHDMERQIRKKIHIQKY